MRAGDGCAWGGMVGRSAKILRRPRSRVAKGGGGVNGPVGVAEHFAGQEDEIGVSGGDDVVGLMRIGDHADGGSGDVGFVADLGSKGNLVAWAGGDFGIGNHAARRAIDEVDAVVAEEGGKSNGIIDGPAFRFVGPVCGGDADG